MNKTKTLMWIMIIIIIGALISLGYSVYNLNVKKETGVKKMAPPNLEGVRDRVEQYISDNSTRLTAYNTRITDNESKIDSNNSNLMLLNAKIDDSIEMIVEKNDERSKQNQYINKLINNNEKNIIDILEQLENTS